MRLGRRRRRRSDEVDELVEEMLRWVEWSASHVDRRWLRENGWGGVAGWLERRELRRWRRDS